MSRKYSIYQFLLTTAAEEVIEGPWSLARLLDATDSAGDVAPGALLTVKAERDAEGAPLRLGQGFLSRDTKRWVVSWEAQAGVTVTLGFSANPGDLDWDADPATQLLSGSFTLAAASVLDTVADVALTAATATEILPADTTRRAAVISNLNANAAIIRIGDSNVAAARGVELLPGDHIYIASTEAIYGYSVPAQSVGVMSLEV